MSPEFSWLLHLFFIRALLYPQISIMRHHCRKIQTTDMCEENKTPNVCKQRWILCLPTLLHKDSHQGTECSWVQAALPSGSDRPKSTPAREGGPPLCLGLGGRQVLGAQCGQQGRFGPRVFHGGSGGVGEGCPRARALSGKGAGERASLSTAQFWNTWYV